jgi:hypothetical protein
MNASVVAKQIEPFIDQFKKNPLLELEGSLGVVGGVGFTSGVDFEHFKALFSTLSVSDWSPCVKSNYASFFHPNRIRATYNARDPPVFIRKTPVEKCDFVCSGRNYDLRVSLREERPVVNQTTTREPSHVRLHERWSFVYKDAWKYDFTKVASGPTKELACRSQPVFEIELELLRNYTFLQSLTTPQLAVHIVEKLVDLLGRFDRNHQVLPYTLSTTGWTSPHNVTGKT